MTHALCYPNLVSFNRVFKSPSLIILIRTIVHRKNMRTPLVEIQYCRPCALYIVVVLVSCALGFDNTLLPIVLCLKVTSATPFFIQWWTSDQILHLESLSRNSSQVRYQLGPMRLRYLFQPSGTDSYRSFPVAVGPCTGSLQSIHAWYYGLEWSLVHTTLVDALDKHRHGYVRLPSALFLFLGTNRARPSWGQGFVAPIILLARQHPCIQEIWCVESRWLLSGTWSPMCYWFL